MPKVTVPMTQKEWEMLKELAKRDGRSMASWIRRGVGEAYASSPKATKDITDARLCVCGHPSSDHMHGNGHCAFAPGGCYCRDFVPLDLATRAPSHPGQVSDELCSLCGGAHPTDEH